MSKAQQTQNSVEAVKKQVLVAFTEAQKGYQKRNPGIVFEAGQYQDDIRSGMNSFIKMSDGQLLALGKLDVNWSDVAKGLSASTNVKIARRLPQFLSFVITQDASFLKGSTLTAFLEFIALGTGAKNRDALKFASTGQGNEHISDSGIDLTKARLVRNAFGTVKTTSRSTQSSVAFSKGGLLEILGIVKGWGYAGHSDMPGLVDNKLSRALSAIVNNATEGKVELWVEQAKPKAAKKTKSSK